MKSNQTELEYLTNQLVDVVGDCNHALEAVADTLSAIAAELAREATEPAEPEEPELPPYDLARGAVFKATEVEVTDEGSTAVYESYSGLVIAVAEKPRLGPTWTTVGMDRRVLTADEVYHLDTLPRRGPE